MFCKNCGKQIDDNSVVCPYCGAETKSQATAQQPQYQQPQYQQPQYQQPYQQQYSEKRSNSYAIAGFVLAFFFALLGLIFSIIGLRKVDECGGSGKGLAIAGIVLSILSMIGAFIIMITSYGTLLAMM
ncbi:MAG TPA: zinc-ribbon domain-containing protein [Candidatus Coproplasma excrementigallinarum]|uniref:Zinc-ribbon domain-containing protein n=1 Tax=Candidatus Coproplasma excrementigallinarum TaxID=2840747 RepID=A0A9D1MJA7_9FIRM|nr:zinc-ribbon domain-containing protein [Candidatus Coproplasma excrementigallinarum]